MHLDIQGPVLNEGTSLLRPPGKMAKDSSSLNSQGDMSIQHAVPANSLFGVARTPSPLESEMAPISHQFSDLDPANGSVRSSPDLEDGLPDFSNWVNSTDALENEHPRLSSGWLKILQESNKRYSLRNTERNTFRGSGLQDLDNSGTYTEGKTERLARPRKSKIRDRNSKSHQSKTLSSEQGKEDSGSKIIHVDVSSNEGSNIPHVAEWPYASKTDDKVSHGYQRNTTYSPYDDSEPLLTDRKGHKRKAPSPTKTKARYQPSNDRKTSPSKKAKSKASAKRKNTDKRGRTQKRNASFDHDLELTTSETSIPGGRCFYLVTSFCHPITFNWTPPPPLPPSLHSETNQSWRSRASSFPCHFCDPGISYAIAGLGQKRVEVIQWHYDSTAGYEELGDSGWVAAGQEGTRLCKLCTMQRVLICLCPKHVIRPIPGLDPRTFDYSRAIQSLVSLSLNRQEQDGHSGDDDGAAEIAASTKWCSVCPDVALYECSTTPTVTTSGAPTKPEDDLGCGLLLCEVCAGRLTGKRGCTITDPVEAIMGLDQHIRNAARDTFQYTDELRADTVFLMDDSELMRRLAPRIEEERGRSVRSEDEEAESDDDEEDDGFPQKPFWGLGSPIAFA